MNLVFLSSVEFESLQPVFQDLVEDSARYGGTVLTTPQGKASTAPQGVQVRPVSVHVPLELQTEARWFSAVERPLLVALSVSSESAAISYRFPTVWLEPTARPIPISRAVALAHRSALVAGPIGLKELLQIPDERFADIKLVTGHWLIDAGRKLGPYRPRSSYHAALSAESFRRYDAGRLFLDDLAGVSPYKRSRITRRFDLAIGIKASMPQHVASTAEDVDPALVESSPELLRQFFELAGFKTLDELLSSDLWRSFSQRPPAVQRMIVVQTLSRMRDAEKAPRESIRALREKVASSGAYELLTPRDISLLGRGPETPDAFLEKVRDRGQPLAAKTAEVELLNRQTKSEMAFSRADVEKLTSVLDGAIALEELVKSAESLLVEIDATSNHPGLWKAACDYWFEMSDDPLDSEPPSPVPPPPSPSLETTPSTPGANDIAGLNRAAGEALKAGETAEAARLYDIIRSVCLQKDPELATTERAARLNAGWAIWKGGAKRREWAPYIVSVLYEIGTPDHFRLRHQLQRLIQELNDPALSRKRYLESIRLRVTHYESLEPRQGREALSRLLNEIDDHAKHKALWESGLSYWRKISGNEWRGSPLDPAPSIVEVDVGEVDTGAISRYEDASRKALRRRRWRRALHLLELLRASCELHDPPIRTTERAARLNIAWVLTKLGRPEDQWRPYLTSVLHEIGPGREFAAVRADILVTLLSEEAKV